MCTGLITTITGVTGSSVDVQIPSLGGVSHNTFYVTANDGLNNQTSCALLPPITYDFDNVYTTVGMANYFQTVSEGATVQVPVTLAAAKNYDVTVNYRASGSALVGGSTLNPSGVGTLTIPAGATTANLTFSAIANGGNQGNRYVDITLYDTTYPFTAVGGRVSHRVLINDNSVPVAAPIQLPMGYMAGYLGACYIDNNKKLYCIGRGLNGTVGDGANVDRENYVPIASSENFAKVVNGQEHVCALTAAGGTTYSSAGAVLCWGLNSNYQIGDGTNTSRNQPTLVTGFGSGAIDIAVGAANSCAIKSDGSLWCWGNNGNGQSRVTATGGNQTTPVSVDPGNAYTSVALGNSHGCAMRAGRIYCWGNNSQGQVGNGSTGGNVTAMTNVDTLISYQQLSVGENYSCGLIIGSDSTNPNRIRCWGQANYNQTGRNNTANSGTPTTVDTGNQYVSITAGKEQACGVTTSGNSPASALRCTGRGDLGMLLDRLGATGNNNAFGTMQTGIAFSKISSGYLSTWGLTTGATTLFGGYNNNFAVNGAGTPVLSKYAATAFDALSTFSSLDVGAGNERSTCAISSGKIRCVGGIADAGGMFGINSAPDMTGYIWVDPQNNYLSVATGRYAMCAIRSDNKLYCAGLATYNGTATASMTLVNVDSGNTFSSVSMGSQTSCGITTSGVLRCWGVNGNGQIGDGSTTNRSSPVTVDGSSAYLKVANGAAHTCGIVAASGQIRCWGAQNNGRLGNNSTAAANIATPTAITDNTAYIDIATGNDFTCGITNANKLFCWGNNGNAQLGDGTTIQRANSTAIDSGNFYLSVAAGLTNGCAVRSNNKMFCWGDWTYGISGQLGANAVTPQAMDPAFNYTIVEMGRYRGCGLTDNNLVRCWGDARFNAWGDFTRTWVPEALPAPGFTQH